MSSVGRRISRGLAKGVGLNLENDIPQENKELAEIGVDAYIEEDPTPWGWLKEVFPNGSQTFNYFHNLFPVIQWIGGYNKQYFWGDVIAGITVGAVLVPQSTAYARLAGLPPEFGLYTGFVGGLTYWLFGTSKDISLGPVAVLSAITGTVVSRAIAADPDTPGHVVASALAVVAGAIICGLGVLKLGFLVDLIPLPSINAFMTGAALSIGVGQVPSLLGIPRHPSQGDPDFVETTDPTYLVFINILRNLDLTRIDAALGVTALGMLYLIRYLTTRASTKFPSQRKSFFFMNTLRITFVILLYTMVSWLVNRHRRDNPMFPVLGTVPRGFRNLAVPVVNTSIIKSFASKLPVIVIVILLEHTASAKSFGRINNYKIQPSQELLASGVANVFGAFFGGYVLTGSFTRTAINSKAGVRTPLSGVVVALVLLLAIYALTSVFFYIPSSVLSAVIIHAVGDLITLPNDSYRMWCMSPIDFLIFITGVIFAIFTDIEIGIYVTVTISAAVIGFRLMKAPGHFLGRIQARSINDRSTVPRPGQTSSGSSFTGLMLPEKVDGDGLDELSERDLFLPIDHSDGTNPAINIEVPLPGIFIYRCSENFNYASVSHCLDQLLQTVMLYTRRTDSTTYKRPGDRPWNHPKAPTNTSHETELPPLRSIILDFSAVNHVDSTSISSLYDLRNQLDRYASPDKVSWHFAHINSRWTKKALSAAGFGYNRDKVFEPRDGEYREHGLRPIYDITNIEESDLQDRETLVGLGASSKREKEEAAGKESERDSGASTNGDDSVGSVREEVSITTTESLTVDAAEIVKKNDRGLRKKRSVLVSGSERPFFHVDLTSALQSAVAEVRHKERRVGVAESDTGVLP